jgi:hypothetical protein
MPPARQGKTRAENTREGLVERAQTVAARLGTKRLALKTFCREANCNPSRIYAQFDNWAALCAEAGLEGGAVPDEIPADELLAALHRAILDAGDIETRSRLMKRIRWSTASYVRRFGGWGETLMALRGWVEANDPAFPFRALLDRHIAQLTRRKPYRGPSRIENRTAPPWRSLSQTPVAPRACGAPLGFRAMLHAPANEMGVVLLFGMVAGDLGYAVDSIGAAFPDCAAKRLVADGPRAADARWEPVRIEFEYRSRAFLHHGHDPAGCDVIVCWEHDWPGCPLEVLALMDVVTGAAGEIGEGAGG